MARAITENFHEYVVEVESETPGTYAAICGLTTRGINRTSNMSTSEVPDCDNEALPAAVERAVQSQEVTISGSGVWASQSHEMMMDWWYSGATKNIRIKHTKAAVGDTEIESGAAYLVNLNHAVNRGEKVTAEIEVQFDGLPTRTAKAA
ncbi:phage tail tube protein [Phyllobacterium lublinensis]|uniref:phage tail tube protein n=1 Tax=Phyllobacterium lublinensis TaxID=2875708 RepID=UPI001CCE3B92|nr:phage tail tube protein [Phyllobacterium sp. 2063]MBZ9653547.1 phage tail protein [Phyllobacterium sp. 2063]